MVNEFEHHVPWCGASYSPHSNSNPGWVMRCEDHWKEFLHSSKESQGVLACYKYGKPTEFRTFTLHVGPMAVKTVLQKNEQKHCLISACGHTNACLKLALCEICVLWAQTTPLPCLRVWGSLWHWSETVQCPHFLWLGWRLRMTWCPRICQLVFFWKRPRKGENGSAIE